MNDILRLLAKILRRYGYDIKRHHQYNLLPIANLDSFNQLSTLYKSAEQDNAAANQPGLDQLHVCLRTCVNGANHKTRKSDITTSTHQELIFTCIHSLVGSINYAVQDGNRLTVKLTVFDDHSEQGPRADIEKILRRANCDVEIRTTRAAGQGESLLEQFEYARDQNALFYFCEDDYLHESSAIAEMVNFYRQVHAICNTHLVIHPQEHEFLYTRHIYPSYLLLGKHRHWRTISHATHTLFTHSHIVAEYWPYFENTRFVGDKKQRKHGAESRTTNLLFDHIPGFAPVPALAAHMQTLQALPPFFDWRALWDKNRPD